MLSLETTAMKVLIRGNGAYQLDNLLFNHVIPTLYQRSGGIINATYLKGDVDYAASEKIGEGFQDNPGQPGKGRIHTGESRSFYKRLRFFAEGIFTMSDVEVRASAQRENRTLATSRNAKPRQVELARRS
jgi:hypothetical protein